MEKEKEIEERRKDLKNVIQEVVGEMISRKCQTKIPWFNKICKDAMERKRSAWNERKDNYKQTQYNA